MRIILNSLEIDKQTQSVVFYLFFFCTSMFSLYFSVSLFDKCLTVKNENELICVIRKKMKKIVNRTTPALERHKIRFHSKACTIGAHVRLGRRLYCTLVQIANSSIRKERIEISKQRETKYWPESHIIWNQFNYQTAAQ